MPDEPQLVTMALLGKVVGVFIVAVAAVAWAYRRLGGRPLWAEEPRSVVPWGAGSVVGAAILFLGLLSLMPPLENRLLAVALAAIVFSGLTPILLRATSGAHLRDLGLGSRDLGRNILRGAAGCALALPLVYLVQHDAVQVWEPESHPVEKAFTARSSVATRVGAALGAVVAAPLAEEILFRGVLLGALWKAGSRSPRPARGVVLLAEPSAWSPRADLAANALASLIFAGLHSAQWPAPIPLFVLSMALGEVYRRSGSLVAPITMHVCFNALSTAALLIGSASGTPGPAG